MPLDENVHDVPLFVDVNTPLRVATNNVPFTTRQSCASPNGSWADWVHVIPVSDETQTLLLPADANSWKSLA